MLAFASTLLACLPAAVFAFSPSFQYGTQKVRGVSLGGWLVIEVRMLLLRACLFFERVLTRIWSSPALDYSEPIRQHE